jgi:hypothetical protein
MELRAGRNWRAEGRRQPALYRELAMVVDATCLRLDGSSIATSVVAA